MDKHRSEADLEARMHAVMKMAFPWLPDEALEHQTRFSIKLGHATIPVDSRGGDRLHGRSDILIRAKGNPLAILELKREGLSLTDEDVTQGLSYARLTTPITPLVVVSNGKDMRIHLTYSGEAWEPLDRTEQELLERLANVGKVAAAGLRNAVCTLLGSDQRHWIPAIQVLSKKLIECRTGDWDDPLAPFVRDFLIPRRATVLLTEAIKNGKRAVTLHGPPLSGKSNVLRELAESIQTSEPIAVLMMEPGDVGVFQAVAHLLASELSWTVSADDAREWLRNISNGTTATLILLLDGIDPSQSALIADLNELASDRFGPALSVIVTVDDSALEAITKNHIRREASAFGRITEEIHLNPLDDMEFKHAVATLARHRIGITPGGDSVLSLREPWILRALVPAYIKDLPNAPPGLMVRIPPIMDIEAMHIAADAFPLDDEAETVLRAAARAIVKQYMEFWNSAALLQRILAFAVERRCLEDEVGATGIHVLRQRGFIKPGIDWAGRSVWFVRVPALVSTHVAAVLAEMLSEWSPDEAVNWLITLASRFPFGDVIAADALIKCATQRTGGNILDLLNALLSRSPRTSSLSPGSMLSLTVSGHLVHATVTQSGKLAIVAPSETIEIDLAEDDLDHVMTDPGGWLILSHIAAAPLGVYIPGESEPARLDEPLLLEVGQAPVVLSRPDGAQDFKEVAVHDIPGHGSIVCHLSGIVEPITWALVKFFLHRGSDADAWIDEAIAQNSLPLLTRAHIALVQIEKIADERGLWAQTTLAQRITPALTTLSVQH